MKYALVTGGSRGIGREICFQLAIELDYHVIINYHTNKEAAEQTLADIQENKGSAELLQFDVADSKEVKTCLQNWIDAHSNATIEVLVNNAGITRDGLFMWMKPDDWHHVININLHGFHAVTQSLLQPMLLNRYGRIINIVSLSGIMGAAGQTNYAAAKGAVIAASKSLSQETAKRNVTVNCVAPGYISSDMTKDLDEAALKKRVPLNRFGRPEEVANVVTFLASRKASYITGEVIHVNGGIYG